MTTRIRAYLSALAARTLNGVEFCDGCAQICDAACRSAAHRDRARLAAAPYIR
jgi:hypothetical protein